MDPVKRVKFVKNWTRIISYISGAIGIGIVNYRLYQDEGFTYTNVIVTIGTLLFLIAIIESVLRWFIGNAEWNPENKH